MEKNVQTERLNLHLLTLHDQDFILELVNSSGWIAFIGDRDVHTTEDAKTYIEKTLHTQDLYYWVVRIKGANTPIGIISFIKRIYLENFDIGFAFLPAFIGNGYAYEAANEILSVMSKKMPNSPILATTIPQNTHSIKLLKKLGLHFDREVKVESKVIHVYSTASSNVPVP